MRRRIIITIAIILTFFVGASCSYLLIKYYPLQIERIQKVIKEYKIEEEATFDAIAEVYDAVVVVETFKYSKPATSGTGFVYKMDDKYGYIITNSHVINSADKVEVILTNGNRVSAKVLGSDTIGDISVLSIPKKDVLKVANIGNTDNIKVGSTVFAIGAPMGSEYSGTTTKGCVSAKNRSLTFNINNIEADDIMMKVIQTDAAINPGNSGGPLINLAGQVIGITSSKLVQEEIEGIGFAIPIDDAMKYTSELEKGQTIKRPLLGAQLLNLDEKYALLYSDIKVGKDITSGVVIQEVLANSAASLAGLKKGDVITKIGNIKVENKAELRYQLYLYDVGNQVKITYIRGGKTKEANVILKSS